VQVWTYQSSGKAGVNFREEYRHVIEKAEHFCVIDSPESRLSTHVKKECQIARECKKPIYVCLVAPRDGSAHEDWWSTNLPFDDFNEIRVILLSDGNYFDGVKELCFALKIHFLPDDLTFPRKDEFWEELAAAQVPFKERDKLLEAWWTFVTLYVEDIRIGEAQLRVLLTLVRQCIGKETVSLLISHGLVLSEMECYDEALCQFRIAISLNPFDPRAWAAAAGAEYRLGNYIAALTSYRHADQILTRQDIPQSDINLPALVHNVSRTLEALGH
jgi:tetratricopeptide (TPR) repeat protein